MKEKKWLIIIFASILLLSVATAWDFGQLEENLANFSLPNFDIEPANFSPQQEEVTQEIFTYDEGGIELFYPSDWKMVSIAGLNQEFLKNNAEMLLFLQKFDIGNSFYSFLILQKIQNQEDDLDSIISSLAEKTEEGELDVNIFEKEIVENTASLSIRYIRDGAVVFNGKEKIIKGSGYVYVLDVVSPPEMQEENEISKIISSFRETN